MGAAVKFFVSTIVIAVILVVILLAVGPALIPQEMIRTRLNEAVQQNLGKSLDYSGPVSLSLFPSAGVTLKRATLQNPDGSGGLLLEDFNVEADSWGLISGSLRLYVEGVVEKVPLQFDIRADDANLIFSETGAPIRLQLNDPQPFELSAILALPENQVILRDLSVELTETRGKGVIRVMLAGAKPDISGALEFSMLNVNELAAMGAYFGGASEKVQQAVKRESDPVADVPEAALPWTGQAFDVSGLKQVNANINIKAAKFSYDQLKMNDAELAVKLRDGTLLAELVNAKLYQGAGTAVVKVEAAKKLPVMTANLALRGVAIKPLLEAFYGETKLSGIGDVTVNLTGAGNSDLALVKGLKGDGRIVLQKGSVEGVDVMSMASLDPTKIIGAFQQVGKTTVIDTMKGGFVIENGVLKNNDLRIDIPFTSLEGRGELDIPTLQVKYRIAPVVGISKLGLRVPVMFRGDVRHPKILPDLQGLVTQGLDGVVNDFIGKKFGTDEAGEKMDTQKLIDKNLNRMDESLKKRVGDAEAESLGGTVRGLLKGLPIPGLLDPAPKQEAPAAPAAPAEPAAPAAP